MPSPPAGTPEPLLAPLLPPGVAAAEAGAAELAGARPPLLAGEESGIGPRAVEARRTSYHWGRALARRAIAQLGYEPLPVRKGPEREPVWPAGLVGSITHCDGYCAAAVAERSAWAAVGIDAEVVQPLAAGVLARIATPAEAERLAGVADPTAQATALFSAKEAVYKAWFPLAGSWLGFHDAAVELEEGGALTATLLVPGPAVGGAPLRRLRGRYRIAGGLVLAAVAVPAGGDAPP